MVSGLTKIQVDGEDYSAATVAEPCWIESKDLDLGDRLHKFVDTFFVEHETGAETKAVIQFGWRDRLQDELTWGPKFPIKDLDEINWTRFTARYFRIRIEDDNPVWLWKLSCIDIFGQKMHGRL